MKRFFQGLFILIGALFAIIIVAAGPGILLFVAFVFLCWGIGRLVFGKSQPNPKTEYSKRNYVEPTKRALSKTGIIILNGLKATNEKLIQPALAEVKSSNESKCKLKELGEELETLKKEKVFEGRLYPEASLKD